jgi:hypothetical protein
MKEYKKNVPVMIAGKYLTVEGFREIVNLFISI